ncbi:hypothetical protein BABINDRAFT_163372 [Babjeviella inositovora NRRL Y-12698]|uniref:Uncharacterized protein n=1 Tax=Babjeviella inositovora NRRL Y-12698 TaxID=984486 RepID=A0A1E3QIZ6_9ASCO|nr:uncharacterized protein BABINDRAFT_163372 [Babjeviella inositovora NRRL Y-12698]ODQ77659.1 hypothetical protein BABINDRAFT_163372 [Babjeviella inositovora NRRL Y-12698]
MPGMPLAWLYGTNRKHWNPQTWHYEYFSRKMRISSHLVISLHHPAGPGVCGVI